MADTMTEAPPGDTDPAAIAARYHNRPEALIEILLDLQEAAGAITDADLRAIADSLNLTRAEVHGVMSFYHDLRRTPAAPAVVKICRGEACQSLGAERLVVATCEHLGVELGATSDRATVEAVYCLGNCALSPAAMVNGRLMGRATVDEIVTSVDRVSGP